MRLILKKILIWEKFEKFWVTDLKLTGNTAEKYNKKFIFKI